MTTAARPTWAPAKGGNEQGGARIFGPSQKFSSRDLAAHTTLKSRKEGQDTQDELQKRNLREELEEREHRHFYSKDRGYADDRDRRKGASVGNLYLEGGRRETEDKIAPRNIDADDSDVDVKNDSDESIFLSGQAMDSFHCASLIRDRRGGFAVPIVDRVAEDIHFFFQNY